MIIHSRKAPAISLLLFLALFPRCGTGEKGPPSVILVSLDTVRADHLGLYGYSRNTTPHLDALENKALVFEQAIAASGNTLISHASLFTGLFPGAHGTTHVDDGIALHTHYQTLAEDFAAAGYATAGFVAHGDWLTRRFGMAQGFDTFKTGYRTADVVLAEAVVWLENLEPSRPYFLFIHLFDVHSDSSGRPYGAEPPFEGMFTRDYQGSLKSWSEQPVEGSQFLKAVINGEITLTPEDLEYLENQYDEGLAYTDDRLGRFLDERAPLDNTFLVIAADHGEEFMDHGMLLHGRRYDEIVRVPLIIVPPPSARASFGVPRRVIDQVRLVDLRPTLAFMAGLPAPVGCQGVDLTTWLAGGENAAPPGPAVIGELSLRHDGFKYLLSQERIELYDLRRDPGEQENLALRKDMQRRLGPLRTLISKQRKEDAAMMQAILQSAEKQIPAVDPEEEERLRNLGYVK